MAFLNADITRNGVRQTALRLGITLGWLCLAAARATADGPVPTTPSLIATPGFAAAPAIPLPFNGLQPHQPGQATDLMSRLSADSSAPLSIPLNVQFGQHSGVSFIYNLAAAAPPQGGTKAPPPPRAASYGFSNALAFGNDSLHLNGLMYVAGNQGGIGQSKQSQLISQALAFENKGWKFDAHYQSVGKDFGAGDTIKGAAAKLGLASNLTDDAAKQLEGLRGQNDLGFSLAHTDTHGNFGLLLKENTNQVTHLNTMEQALSLGHNFGHGMQFEASRDTVSAKPTQGDLSKALTTTTNHLKLGMDQGKGMSFSAEANLIGDSKGRSEQHMVYNFADQIKDAQFHTSFQTNSVKKDGSHSTSDQTLGVDFDRQAKGLGLKASFLQFASTTTGGQSLTKTTEHLEMGMKDTQLQANLLSNTTKNADGTAASDKTLNLDMVRQTKGLSLKASLLQFSTTAKNGQGRTNENLEMNWQARKDVTFQAHWTQAALLTNSTGKTDTDKNLGIDIARQGTGLTWKASFLQDAPTADKAQAKTTEHFEMNWQARKDVLFQGHWNRIATETVHANAPADGANQDEQRDLTATLNSLRLHGLRNSQAVLNLAQTISQGKMQTDTRALRFETDAPDTHVHLEYTDNDCGLNAQRNSLVSRAVRIANIAPGDWMHYSIYYKQRSQTLGGHLPDIRDYQVGMKMKHINIAYHYMNQQEQPNGSIKDTVESHYEMDGPLTRKLAWNVQYDQTDDHTGKSGLEAWLIGVKSAPTPHDSLEMMIGRPELRVDGITVPGETFKLTFICKMDEADSVAFNGEVTNWERKTRQTPHTVDGNVRVDLAKGF